MRLRPTYLGVITLVAVVVAGGVAWWCARAPLPVESAPPPVQTLIMADGSIRTVDVGRDGLGQIRPTAPRQAPAPVGMKTTAPSLRIIGDPACSLPQRLASVDGLFKAPLPPATLVDVLTYLSSPVQEDIPAAERERALRNQLLNALRQGSAYAQVAVPALVKQAADPKQDDGMRDYALQHLAAWVPTLPPAEKQAALSALEAALLNPAGTYSGTALIGLNDLARRNCLDPKFDISAEERRIVLDEKYNISSRLTALTLVAERPVADPAVETLARQWAESPYIQLGARRAAEAFLRKR
jgi:hypothetical protein